MSLAKDGLAYVLDGFPIPSERFISTEVNAVAHRGVPTRLCLLKRGQAKKPLRETDTGPAVWSAGLRLLARQPSAVARQLASEVARLASYERRGVPGALRWLVLAARYAVHLERHPPALVHAHFALSPGVVARFLGLLLRRPWGVSVHAQDIYVEPRGAAARLRGCSYVVACSGRAAQDVQLVVGDQTPVYVVHHGLDLSGWAARKNQSIGGPHIIGVGRQVPKKGFETLIRACAQLRPRLETLHCTLVGDGAERVALERLARQLAAPVTFAPWCSPEELRAVYEGATMLVMPCRVASDGDRDNIPNVVVEAMATGLPVVASALPALQALVGASEACLLLERSQPELIAEAIYRIATDRALSERMSAAGRTLVGRHFDQSTNITKLLDIFGRHAWSDVRPSAHLGPTPYDCSLSTM